MQAQIAKLQTCVEKNLVDEGMAIVQQVKIARLTQAAGVVSDEEYTKVLEAAVLLSIAAQDVEMMLRHVQQSKSHSKLSAHMQGLQLMALLVQNMDAEFHATLEMLVSAGDDTILNSPLLQFPITLERKLMVGMYDQILQVQVPHSSFQFFLETLQTHTVREAIGDTLEVSYTTLTLQQAGELMGIPDTVATYVAEERDDWIVNGKTITFQPPTNEHEAIVPAAEKWMQQTLHYAGEMEQIV